MSIFIKIIEINTSVTHQAAIVVLVRLNIHQRKFQNLFQLFIIWRHATTKKRKENIVNIFSEMTYIHDTVQHLLCVSIAHDVVDE